MQSACNTALAISFTKWKAHHVLGKEALITRPELRQLLRRPQSANDII